MLILASSSPRRSELLRNAGIEFRVEPADVPEFPEDGEAPEVYVQRLARDKAKTVGAKNPGSYVLGADTVVIVDHHLLEKPADGADVARMLRLLSGRTHQVTTGVCVLAPGREADVRTATTEVTFSKLSDEEIVSYIASGEPMGKAGAYGIQGMASRWVSRIEGSYFNVVGLPISLVYEMLRDAGAL